MFRFDQLIRPAMTVRDIKRQFPQTVALFESFGYRDICDDCALEVVARKHGRPPLDIVDALNWAVFGKANGQRE